jgi:hypothetical protein
MPEVSRLLCFVKRQCFFEAFRIRGGLRSSCDAENLSFLEEADSRKAVGPDRRYDGGIRLIDNMLLN